MDISHAANDFRGPFNTYVGLTFTHASNERVEGFAELDQRHQQPYGIVHGGVYATLSEAACSTGAAADALTRGMHAVGAENSTSFVRAFRSGRVTIVAVPLHRGRRSQVWRAEVRDPDDRLLAEGRVRCLCLEQDTALAGQTVDVQT